MKNDLSNRKNTPFPQKFQCHRGNHYSYEKNENLYVVSELCISTGQETVKECEPADKNLIVVSVVISAAVLLGIITGIFIWIIKVHMCVCVRFLGVSMHVFT